MHRPGPQAILRGDAWEAGTIEFMISQRRHGDVITAGTYFGDFLPALSKSSPPDAKIWAFEPDEESYRCSLITICINKLQNVNIVNAGLGEIPCSKTMATSHADGKSLGGAKRIIPEGKQAGDLRFEGQPLDPNATETIRVVTIDESVPPDRNVSLIQLDVEEYEKQALAGALNTIRRCRPIIIVESLPEEEWLAKNILGLGYRVLDERISGNAVLSPDGRMGESRGL